MKNLSIIVIIALSISLFSCQKKGEIQISNNVHNVKLETVSFNDDVIAYDLYTGASSDVREYNDFKNTFPRTSTVEFYMVSGGNRVFLITKDEFSVEIDKKTIVVIDDQTEVVNPAAKNQTAQALSDYK